MVSRETELWSATRVLAMHQADDGRCAHCTREGCRLKVWAESIRQRAAADGYALPPIAPVWPAEGVGGFAHE